MPYDERQALAALLVGTAYSYLHGFKEIPFDEISEDLNAIITCGLANQGWFVSISSKHHNHGGMQYYDIGIMTDGEPIAIRAVLQNGQIKTSLH